MARTIYRHNGARNTDTEAVPPFWLQADENGTPLIDPSVIEVARDNWPWAFYLVKRQLNDGSRAREVVQEMAVEVTSRLREDAEVGRNLNGYFRTAMIRHVKSLVVRESRITYQGTGLDLEASHQPSAPDWTKVFEDRITLQSLACYMSHPVRRILHYRLLDYTWKQIASRLGLSEKQAKSRFYYGVHQAYEELLGAQAMRVRRNARNDNECPL